MEAGWLKVGKVICMTGCMMHGIVIITITVNKDENNK